ncbi:glycosyltransferase [Bacteroides sp. 214]|uniref:glycosyltransferase n=1 Tax=Bacteroides sp. 214 TaxID=2302935 RepID=UPI0013D869A0|nr:glycosyltransferase [Bacteroides sp. 214]NDW12801.1 glycosyltransferase [Bacteroides sp. 214]
MKILIINSILYSVENNTVHEVNSIKDTMIVSLANEFVAKEHQITLVAAEEYKPISEEGCSFNIIYLPSNLKRIFNPSLLPLHLNLFSYLRKHKEEYDLVITSEVFSFNSLFASIVMPQKTIIWQELGKYNKMMKEIPARIWYNVIARCFMNKPLIVARSPVAKRFIQSFNLRVYEDIISHGSNLTLPKSGVSKKKQFIVVARLVPGKNIISMISVYKKYITTFSKKDYKLYIAGDGPMRNEIEEYVFANGLDGQVVLLGNVIHDKLTDYFASSLCMFCNSSKDLNMIAIEESISLGTPIITNTVPYSAEWIKNNTLGIAKDNWDEHDIHEIVENSKLYINNCMEYSPKLSRAYIVDRFINILKSPSPAH